MFLIRNIFNANPGKAKALVEIFKKAVPIMEANGIVKNTRILTDSVGPFWTVILEGEVENLNNYLDMAKGVSGSKELGEAMKGYIDLVKGGQREIYKIE